MQCQQRGLSSKPNSLQNVLHAYALLQSYNNSLEVKRHKECHCVDASPHDSPFHPHPSHGQGRLNILCLSLSLSLCINTNLCFFELSVVANTTDDCASYAFVIHAFVPSNTHSSPSRRAVVLAAPGKCKTPYRKTRTQESQRAQTVRSSNTVKAFQVTMLSAVHAVQRFFVL